MSKLTRRQLLAAGFGLAGTAALLHGCGSDTTTTTTDFIPSPSPLPPSPLPSPTPSRDVPPFPQPAVRRSTAGVLDTSLECRLAPNKLGGQSILTPTYEGTLGGPTFRVRPGDTLRVKLINNLPPNPDQNQPVTNMNVPHNPYTTNVHPHGFHTSPMGNGDNVFVQINPGDTFQYEWRLPPDHPSGLFWYHPHKHGSTSTQLFGGMSGCIIVEGGPGTLDDVPEVKVARDLIYMVNEINVDPTTGMVPPFVAAPPNAPNAFTGPNSTLTVNGLIQPVLVAQPGEVFRLRFANATVRSQITLAIDNHELNLLALDGLTLPRVRTTTSVETSAANRVDLLVKAGAPGVYAIRRLPGTADTNPVPGSILGYLQVAGPQLNMALPTGALPVSPTLPDILASEITNRRTMTFAVSPTGGPLAGFGNFTINGVQFNENVVNQTVRLNAVEEWTLVNTSGTEHPFHIHINPFQVISINGVPLPVPEWKDTISIPKAGPNGPGTVVIRQRYKDFTGMYVFHCHILIHEDLGMMQIVNCVP